MSVSRDRPALALSGAMPETDCAAAGTNHAQEEPVTTETQPQPARRPDSSGYLDRDGVRLSYEAYGDGPATILMLPTWSVLDSRHGRFQLSDLSRHYRVVTFDPRGNGRSDRPQREEAYSSTAFVEDAVAVLDATGTDRAVVVACSLATYWQLQLAAEHPDRVLGVVASGSNLPLAPGLDRPEMGDFMEPYRSTEGWARFNAQYWKDDYPGFLRFFFEQVWIEPHSERIIDACVANGLQTTPETLIASVTGDSISPDETRELVARSRCPWLVIHGDGDRLQPYSRAEQLADQANGSLVTLLGAGHCSGNRDPVRFNLLVREFTEELLGWRPTRRAWTRARSRARRCLMIPGDARPDRLKRDRAIATALRAKHPDLVVEWLAPEPARSVLTERGEQVHPASADLPDGDGSSADDFSDWWARDEAQLLQFTIATDIAEETPLDMVVADGARGFDHHLHENPELKRYAYAWLADTVGWVPEAGATPERRVRMADANAEMVDQIERYPRVRDRAFYLGRLADLPAEPLGDELQEARAWAASHFACTGSDPARAAASVAGSIAELL